MSLHRFHKTAFSRLLHLEPPKRRFISTSQNYDHSPPKRETRLNDDRILPHQERYRHGHSDALEDVELYRPGGLHPVTVGDVLDHGRYHLVHKLGDGKGSSTVWLARDLRSTGKSNSSENLVSIKIRRASNPDQERFRSRTTPREMQIVRALHNSAVNRGQSEICSHLLSIHSSFTEVGPNGTHICLVSSAAGPSLYWMRYWRKHGRYHQQLVRKICQQVAESLQLIHASGYVHGDLRPANMLFQLTDNFRTLSDDELYVALGKPESSPLRQKQELPDSHGPRGVVPSIDPKKFLQAELLRENVVLTGFGSSFHSTEKRSGHHLEHTITVDYQAPEIMMDDQVTQAIDIWALGCFIFEMRCGWSLFDPTLGGADEVLHRIVYSLGKLPERWWNSWSNHYKYFRAWGAAKKPYGYPSLRSAFGHVGTKDQPTALTLSLFEKPGTPITEEELLLLDDLLHKMLRYRPEDRITMDQVVCHPWFAFQ